MASVEFDHYTASTKGTRFSVEAGPHVPALIEDTRVFDKLIYGREVHPPVPLFSTEEALTSPHPRCLDMPIRLAGESEYAVPEEWTALIPLIQRVAAVEQANNSSALQDYHTYMTVDCSHVEPGITQRRSGLHVDGFQGARITEKTKTTRNYVATSNGGTRFFPQLFFSALDESVYDLFKGFDKQAQDPIVAPEHTVVFMDAYSVHESGAARFAGLRCFLRITYDVKIFDRLGNTKNPMLAYDWPMVARDVQSTLVDPPRELLQ